MVADEHRVSRRPIDLENAESTTIANTLSSTSTLKFLYVKKEADWVCDHAKDRFASVGSFTFFSRHQNPASLQHSKHGNE